MYLLITGVDTMNAYLAFEGMGRFCTEEYNQPSTSKNSEDPKEDLMAHLTNYTLNKMNHKFEINDDFKVTDNGHKRLLSNLFFAWKDLGVDIEDLKEELKDIATKIVISLQPYLVNSFHVEMGVGKEVNQSWFHIFGIDILIDEKHKPWLLEINWFPSFCIFQEKYIKDPIDGKENKIKFISEYDKYLKTLILKEAIQTVKDGETPEGSIFEKVFPPDNNAEDYKHLTVFNEARILFELLSGFRRPDYLTHSQFQKLSHFPGMRNESLTKPTYTLVFKQFAKRANRSLMTFDNFTSALEYIGRELLPTSYTRQMVLSQMVKQILEYLKT